MTNIGQLGSHMTNIEHFSRDTFRVCRVTRRTATEQTTNTATVLHFVCIGMTASESFVDASGLVGDAKQLRLPRFDGYLSVSNDLESPSFQLILHPVVNPPTQKLYIN